MKLKETQTFSFRQLYNSANFHDTKNLYHCSVTYSKVIPFISFFFIFFFLLRQHLYSMDERQLFVSFKFVFIPVYLYVCV